MNDAITIVSVLFLISGGMTLFLQYFLRYVLSYKLAEDSVKVIFLGFISVKKIEYKNILSIEKITFRQTFNLWLVQRLGNKIWGDIVLIKLKKGFVKNILITPDDAAECIDIVKSKLVTS